VARARLTLLPYLEATALSAKVGALSNFSGFSAPLLGLEAALRTDRLGPELAVSLEADYAHRGYSEMQRVGASTSWPSPTWTCSWSICPGRGATVSGT